MPAATHLRAFVVDHDTDAFRATGHVRADGNIDTAAPGMRGMIDAALSFTRARMLPLSMHVGDAIAKARLTLDPPLKFAAVILTHDPKPGLRIEDPGLKDHGRYAVDLPLDPTTLQDLPDENDTIGSMMYRLVSDAVPVFAGQQGFPADALQQGLDAWRDSRFGAFASRTSQPIVGTKVRAEVGLYMDAAETVRTVTLIHRGVRLARLVVARGAPGATHVPKRCAEIRFDGEALHIAQMAVDEHEWWKGVTRRRDGIGPLAEPVTLDLFDHADAREFMKEKS